MVSVWDQKNCHFVRPEQRWAHLSGFSTEEWMNGMQQLGTKKDKQVSKLKPKVYCPQAQHILTLWDILLSTKRVCSWMSNWGYFLPFCEIYMVILIITTHLNWRSRQLDIGNTVLRKPNRDQREKKKKMTAKHFCIIKLFCDNENNSIISVSPIC